MDSPDTFGKPLVILNPAANRGNMHMYRTLLRSRLAMEQAEYRETRGPGEAKALAEQAGRERRALIVVGGDGTLNEVVNGLLTVGERVPLGIVASGSGNDFAWHALKLPEDPAEAIERAFTGKPIAVDAGVANGTYFVNAFDIGLDADIAAAANALKKVPLLSGKRLYYTSVLKQLLFGYHRCPWLTFHLSDGINEHIMETSRHYVLMAVTNGPTYGAGFHINPAANVCDGLFNICTIDYTPLLRALSLLPIVQRGEHATLPEVTFYQAKKVHIESARPVCVALDGETTRGSCFEIELLPGVLCVRV